MNSDDQKPPIINNLQAFSNFLANKFKAVPQHLKENKDYSKMYRTALLQYLIPVVIENQNTSTLIAIRGIVASANFMHHKPAYTHKGPKYPTDEKDGALLGNELVFGKATGTHHGTHLFYQLFEKCYENRSKTSYKELFKSDKSQQDLIKLLRTLYPGLTNHFPKDFRADLFLEKNKDIFASDASKKITGEEKDEKKKKQEEPAPKVIEDFKGNALLLQVLWDASEQKNKSKKDEARCNELVSKANEAFFALSPSEFKTYSFQDIIAIRNIVVGCDFMHAKHEVKGGFLSSDKTPKYLIHDSDHISIPTTKIMKQFEIDCLYKFAKKFLEATDPSKPEEQVLELMSKMSLEFINNPWLKSFDDTDLLPETMRTISDFHRRHHELSKKLEQQPSLQASS